MNYCKKNNIIGRLFQQQQAGRLVLCLAAMHALHGCYPASLLATANAEDPSEPVILLVALVDNVSISECV